MKKAKSKESKHEDDILLSEKDLVMEKGLPAREIDRRLTSLTRAHRRLESVLGFYLQEVDKRQLYLEYSHASTVDYARERLGLDEEDGGFARNVAERDGWQCTRPGCRCRSRLTGNHIIPRGRCGADEDWNIHLVCAACHLAITEGRLKVSGRAPVSPPRDSPFGLYRKSGWGRAQAW